MSEYVPSTTVTARGLGLFTDYTGQVNVKLIIGVYLDLFQDIETAIYAVYLSRQLDKATGAQLDLLGALVGQARGNFSDTDYKPLIRARILVNRSDGTSRAITDIAAAMIRGSNVTAAYVDTYDFKWQISFFNVLASFSYAVVVEWANMLRRAKALGSGTDIIYSGTSTDHTLIWCTVAEQNTTASQWDTVAGSGKGDWSLYA
jgi:hypothetical protein